MAKNQYEYSELIECAKGQLFGKGNAQLPLPNMLMLDRITHVSKNGGQFNSGEVIAELDVRQDAWFFGCHFMDDPVMPGCLGLDATWQLVGFFLGWSGYPGRGRALGCGEVRFRGQVLPDNRLIRYHVQIKKIANRGLVLGVADAKLFADDKAIYFAKDLRVGLF